MRIRLFAILVIIAAGSMILVRFNAADEQTTAVPNLDGIGLVSLSELKADRWYSVQPDDGFAEIHLPERHDDATVEIVVTTLGGGLRESQVVVETGLASPAASSRRRYSPVEQIQCRQNLSSESRGPFSSSTTPVFVSDEDAINSVREFRIPLMSPDGNLGRQTVIQSKPAVRTDHVEVLIDTCVDNHQPTRDLAIEIADVLEQRVIPVLTQKIGKPYDVDGSGRLSIVLSPKVPGFTKGKKRVKGFVLPDDVMSTGETDRQANGNNADVIFLDSCLPIGESLVTLLAHEFTHVVSLSNARRRQHEIPAMWINEAIAHVGERLCSENDSNIRDRLQTFFQGTHSTPLLLDEFSFDHLQRDPAVRGASFSFLDWCVRACDDELIRELTLQSEGTVAVLEAETGLSFDQLVQQWGLALASSNRPAFLEIPGNKEPMTVKVIGTGNLFLTSKAKFVRIRCSQDVNIEVAFRFRANSSQ